MLYLCKLRRIVELDSSSRISRRCLHKARREVGFFFFITEMPGKGSQACLVCLVKQGFHSTAARVLHTNAKTGRRTHLPPTRREASVLPTGAAVCAGCHRTKAHARAWQGSFGVGRERPSKHARAAAERLAGPSAPRMPNWLGSKP